LAEKLRKASRWKQDIFGGLGQAWGLGDRLGRGLGAPLPSKLLRAWSLSIWILSFFFPYRWGTGLISEQTKTGFRMGETSDKEETE
jgi:hypothetical protein